MTIRKLLIPVAILTTMQSFAQLKTHDDNCPHHFTLTGPSITIVTLKVQQPTPALSVKQTSDHSFDVFNTCSGDRYGGIQLAVACAGCEHSHASHEMLFVETEKGIQAVWASGLNMNIDGVTKPDPANIVINYRDGV